MDFFQKLAMVIAVVLPFWNIPLISRMIRRRSSEDVSIYWALGVWTCLLLLAPTSFTSIDPIFRVFSIFNFIFFSTVAGVVLYFRIRSGK